MSLSAMKKSNSLDKLLGAAVQENKPQEKKSYVDERIWKPVMDKTGNGFAIIRFLPAPKGEELPWVKLWNHAFQGPTGQWYIENSLTTISQNDPVSELNTKFWNSGVESDKEIARKQKRKLQTRLNTVLSGTTKVGNVTDMQTGSAFDDSPSTTTVVDTKEEPAPTVSMSNTEDDDDTMSYFEKLAEEG